MSEATTAGSTPGTAMDDGDESERAESRIDRIASALKNQADLAAIARADESEMEKTLRVILSVLPRRTGDARWDEAIGPFYSWRAVAEIIGGVTRPTVDNHREDHQVLGVKSKDNRWLYPTFQWVVGAEGLRTLSMLAEVLTLLEPARHDDGLHAAWWLVTPNRLLDGMRPVDWMRDERDPARLLRAARAEADSLDPATAR